MMYVKPHTTKVTKVRRRLYQKNPMKAPFHGILRLQLRHYIISAYKYSTINPIFLQCDIFTAQAIAFSTLSLDSLDYLKKYDTVI